MEAEIKAQFWNVVHVSLCFFVTSPPPGPPEMTWEKSLHNWEKNPDQWNVKDGDYVQNGSLSIFRLFCFHILVLMLYMDWLFIYMLVWGCIFNSVLSWDSFGILNVGQKRDNLKERRGRRKVICSVLHTDGSLVLGHVAESKLSWQFVCTMQSSFRDCWASESIWVHSAGCSHSDLAEAFNQLQFLIHFCKLEGLVQCCDGMGIQPNILLLARCLKSDSPACQGAFCRSRLTWHLSRGHETEQRIPVDQPVPFSCWKTVQKARMKQLQDLCWNQIPMDRNVNNTSIPSQTFQTWPFTITISWPVTPKKIELLVGI